MRFLVLGGTAPLGAAVATAARDRGHDVTCLARGSSGPAPDGVRLVLSDRSRPAAYDEVARPRREWDAVLEVAWQPGFVRAALAGLGDRAAHWTYVSSCSVYAQHDEPGADETAALLPALRHDVDDCDREQYGEAKVTCELASTEAVGERLHVSRAGLLAGPQDRSDRVGYWPARFARGGEVLAPAAAGQVSAALDFRDYATFLVEAAERGETGTMNAMGPPHPTADVIALSCEVADGPGPVVVDDDWLVAQGVEPFMGPESLPLWLPDPAWVGFMQRSTARAVASGLVARPLVQTLADTLVAERAAGLDRPRSAGLTPQREALLLRAWGSRT